MQLPRNHSVTISKQKKNNNNPPLVTFIAKIVHVEEVRPICLICIESHVCMFDKKSKRKEWKKKYSSN